MTQDIAAVAPITMPSSDRRGFFGALESLRGIAALLVAVFHVSWVSPIQHAGFVRNSYLMVDVFFVLSGFVICHAYRERITNRGDLRDFFVLRLGRLYPLHLTMLGVFLAKEVAKYGAQTWLDLSGHAPAFTENNGRALASNLLLIHSLGLHGRLTFNDPSWSISTEFYTYVVFALGALVMSNRLKRWQLPSFVAISAVSLGVLLFAGRRDLNVMYDFGWFRCSMGFFLGAASYIVFAGSDFFCSRRVRDVAPYVAIAALVGGALFLEFKTKGQSDFVFLPLTAILIVALAASPGSAIDRWFQIRPLTYLGKISYSVYMVHFALSWAFGSILVAGLGFENVTMGAGSQLILTDQITGTIALLLYVGVVLLVSTVTFRCIEEPFRRKARAFVVNPRARGAGIAAAPDVERLTTVTSPLLSVGETAEQRSRC